VSALAGQGEVFHRIFVDTSSHKPVYVFLGKRYADLNTLKEEYLPNFLYDIPRREQWEPVPGREAPREPVPGRVEPREPRRVEEPQGFEPEFDIGFGGEEPDDVPDVGAESDEEEEYDVPLIRHRRRRVAAAPEVPEGVEEAPEEGEEVPEGVEGEEFHRPLWIRKAGTRFIKEDFAREIGQLLDSIERERSPSIFSCVGTYTFNTEQKAFQAILRAISSWGRECGVQDRARGCVQNLPLFERFCLLEMAVKTDFLLQKDIPGVQRFLRETLNVDRERWDTLDGYIEDNYPKYGRNRNSGEEAIEWLESFIR